jgi:hypothetical protein
MTQASTLGRRSPDIFATFFTTFRNTACLIYPYFVSLVISCIVIQTLRRMAQCESALLSLFVRVARQELAAGFTERAVALFQVRW